MPPMKSRCFFGVPSPRILAAVCLLALPGVAAVPPLEAQSLQGSRTSLLRQNEMARQHDYTYLQTSDQVHEFARRGLLVRLSGNSSYRLAAVSFPYARAEVKTFVERLGSQYRAACGERLVVTSLTRPISRQPRNASHLSVHPTGMAVDLRRSNRSSCRRWIEKTLLVMEQKGLVEATRERHPPHYHVTLFPKPYMRYLASKGVRGETALASADTRSYRVGRGDSLWTIARRHGTSVSSLKKANNIRSSRLKPGQVLEIPVTR
jgi:LysM repeat protein